MSERIAPFEGVGGHLFHRTFALGTLGTGALLTVVTAIVVFVLTQAEHREASGAVVQVIVALLLARFAMSGFAGEWAGSFFSSAAGDWTQTIAVAVRYFVLSLVWIIPAVFLDASRLAIQPFGGEGVGLAGAALIVTGIIALLSPPLFLIASVAAERFSDIARADHWRCIFRGRLRELSVLYALYTGSVVLLLLLAVALTVVVALLHVKSALVAAAVLAAFVAGYAVTFLGRLCGFFAFLASDREGETFERGALLTPDRPPHDYASRVYSVDPSPRILLTAKSAMSMNRPAGTSGADVLRESDDTRVSRPVERKPPLLDAKERVAAIASRGEGEEKIELLEGLRRDFAPAPLVLHALTLAYHAAGRNREAFEIAREAVPLCLQRGNLKFAAGMYERLLPEARELSLKRDEVIAIANSLREMKRLDAATRTYMDIVSADPTESRAIKGLLQTAHADLQKDGETGRALASFEFLLDRCPDSPLADFMREGKQQAESRLQAAGG